MMNNKILNINTFVIANKPSCPCKKPSIVTVQGSIKKIINNQSGIWYYLSSGHTIKHDWIINI